MGIVYYLALLELLCVLPFVIATAIVIAALGSFVVRRVRGEASS